MTVLRQANRDARTVLITGHRSELDSLVAEVLADGADAVCYKPFDLDHLLRTLEQLTADGRKSAPVAPTGYGD
jgi:ActR/RegA family two-component response regulator